MIETKTGTKEWAPHSHNIGVGCGNLCLYCYARYNAVDRFHSVKSRAEWERERIKYGIRKVKPVKKDGPIMFPTTHDISEFYLSEFIISARGLLEVGNNLLIVSKPRMICIQQICAHLGRWKSQILFRFTIGTLDEAMARFWEPGAPLISERIECLRYVKQHGWETSVSAEPLLGGYDTAISLIKEIDLYITETAWFGKMNQIRQRVDCRDRDVLKRVQELERQQSNAEMLRLHDALRDNPKVRWKDSIAKIVARLEGPPRPQTEEVYSEA